MEVGGLVSFLKYTDVACFTYIQVDVDDEDGFVVVYTAEYFKRQCSWTYSV